MAPAQKNVQPSKATAVKPQTQAPAKAKAEESTEEVRMKAGRKIHPLVGSDDEKQYPFTWALEAIPAGPNGKGGREATAGNFPKDFSHKSNAYLTKEDFTNEESFFLYKADEARFRMEGYLAMARGARLGSAVKDQKGAKRLLKYQQQMADLRKQLEADGVDVDALLSAQSSDEAKA